MSPKRFKLKVFGYKMAAKLDLFKDYKITWIDTIITQQLI